jgi:hypothetical protein
MNGRYNLRSVVSKGKDGNKRKIKLEVESEQRSRFKVQDSTFKIRDSRLEIQRFKGWIIEIVVRQSKPEKTGRAR